MIIRFFAAAAEAAGTESQQLTLTPEATVAEVVDTLGADNPALAGVLEHCSFLLDGVSVADRTATIGQAGTLDVLPPFAGG